MNNQGDFLENPAMRSSVAATGTRTTMRASSISTTTIPTTRTTTSASADPKITRLGSELAHVKPTIIGRKSPGDSPKAGQYAKPKTAAGLTSAAAELGNSTVSVLFARADSIYKSIPNCDVWDIERDARKWPGNAPVVAHPPCRAWGRLRQFANPRPDEKSLALFAIDQIRKFGGVLEHPAGSTLWDVAHLPNPGERDSFGGWTLPIYQSQFGHKAQKSTYLYIVGCEPRDIPSFPLVLGEASHTVSSSGRRRDGTRLKARPEITKAEREHTPPN